MCRVYQAMHYRLGHQNDPYIDWGDSRLYGGTEQFAEQEWVPVPGYEVRTFLDLRSLLTTLPVAGCKPDEGDWPFRIRNETKQLGTQIPKWSFNDGRRVERSVRNTSHRNTLHDIGVTSIKLGSQHLS